MPMRQPPDGDGAQPFLILPKTPVGPDVLSWHETVDAVNQRAASFPHLRGRRAGLIMRPGADSFLWLLALRELAATCALIAPATESDRVAALVDSLDLEYLIDGEDVPSTGRTASAPNNDGRRVIILTSGTTGTPKAVLHSWDSLARPVRTTPALHGSRWLITFAPHLYAGLQVFLHAWLNHGMLVALPPGWTPETALDAIAAHRVGYISATPSFWRYVLLSTGRELQGRCRLSQITLGGESTDQALLDRLKAAFPSARLIHIYATTELGRCFSVTDGREGFPASFLNSASGDGIELKVDSGELLVRSLNRMIGYVGTIAAGAVMSESDGWIRTGDNVEIAADRVYFRGRNTDIANVGGHKVSPVAVEDFLRSLPEVEDAVVYIVPSSIAGQLLGADLVLRPDLDRESAKAAILRQCAQSLAPPMRPRFWKLVDEIPLLPGGKRIRSRDIIAK